MLEENQAEPSNVPVTPGIQKRILPVALGLVCLAFASTAAVLFWPGQAEADFKWFGSLGWPEVKDKPLVRVLKKRWEKDTQPSKKQYTLGFLLEESTNSFTVLTLDLRTMTYAPSNGRQWHYFENAEITEEAETFPILRADNNYLPGWVQGFVLAWGCKRHGHPSKARDLYQKVGATKNRAPMATNLWQKLRWRTQQIVGKVPRNLSIRQQLELDLAHFEFGRIIGDFAKPSIGRSELLQRFQGFVKHYPSSPRLSEAQDYIDKLNQLIREDEEHSQALKPLAQMTPEERAKELVFQLRNQTGHGMKGGGWYLFYDMQENTPAYQLRSLGYAAAPELIRALHDNRLTRTVDEGHNVWYPVGVVTVGQCAHATLSEIFDRGFTGGDLRGCKTPEERYQRCWESVQAHGLKQFLVDGVRKGDAGSVAQAEQLLNVDPSALVAALPVGYENAREGVVKWGLLKVAGRVPGNGLNAFLHGQLEETNAPDLVIVAARNLFLKGDEQMVPLMMRRLEKLPLTASDGNALAIIDFLARCMHKEAVNFLAKDLTSRPLKARFELLDLLRPAGDDPWKAKSLAFFWNLERPPAAPPEYLTAVETLLVQCLEDLEEEETGNEFYDGKVRVCDCAGRALAERWNNKYQFDFWGSRKQRDRQRLECIQVWREGRGGTGE